jgi:hypothetical protein
MELNGLVLEKMLYIKKVMLGKKILEDIIINLVLS